MSNISLHMTESNALTEKDDMTLDESYNPGHDIFKL